MIHREALIAKKISSDRNVVVQDAVAHSIPVFLQIFVMKWNQSLRLFYCIVTFLGGFQKAKH